MSKLSRSQQRDVFSDAHIPMSFLHIPFVTSLKDDVMFYVKLIIVVEVFHCLDLVAHKNRKFV